MSDTKFEMLAMRMFFAGELTPEMMRKCGVEFKEGKERADVIRAYNKGWDAGRGKFEREARMAGLEIAEVCK